MSTSQAAERDWEEKRASLTQYSAQDINRLLEETQAELMKAIPDLDFAAKQIKPSSNTPSQTPQSGAGTPEHRVNKPQHKLSGKEGGSRRGSGKMESVLLHYCASLTGTLALLIVQKNCFGFRITTILFFKS